MMDPFNRAERWRSRAAELRAIADRLSERDARASTLAIANSLEHHARNLEAVAVKFNYGGRAALREAAD
jgi:hypothetical protein